MKGIDFEKTSKIMCIWLLSGIFFIILFSQFGIIENWGYDLTTKRPRYSLGYYYPSYATSVILYGILLLCYVLKQRLKLWQVFLLEFFNYLQYMQTDSRTGTALWGWWLLVTQEGWLQFVSSHAQRRNKKKKK